MAAFWIMVCLFVLAAAGFILGRIRALRSCNSDRRLLHSLPIYYSMNVAILTLVPALIILIGWALTQPLVVNRATSSMIAPESYQDRGALNLIMSDVRRIADGLDVAVAKGALSPKEATSIRIEFTDVRARLGDVGVALGSDIRREVLTAAQRYRTLNNTGRWIMTGAVLALALAGLIFSLRQIDRDFRARNWVERSVLYLLIGAALIAIMTTLGIVLSLVFNTIEFFKLYPARDFFFGTVWSPSFGGNSQLGVLPLFWGTFYISAIALMVAVPIGLFAAVYLSEYASHRTRSFAKPMLEVLAGIPTLVYGLFALLTVGPMLVSVFGYDGGLGWMKSGTAVITAGLVMGIMLIPFVSSLSDDIINSVPQDLRDGSLGIGATKSETVRQVVLPAALPGIVGAILLAASRAIGETMIVVVGAGAAARLSMNPFDAMTTVTAKIVSQLTGDADFASPEALVAFALGMTLFVITLGLNIFALYIVRKYREQYE